MIQFHAKIIFDKNENVYNVEFPDLPGCLTFGATLAEARSNAADALTGYLESIASRNLPIPKISETKKKKQNTYLIKPSKKVAFALSLRQKRIASGLTQKKIASILNISYQTYQRFENPSKSNPTLKTIEKIENVLEKELVNV